MSVQIITPLMIQFCPIYGYHWPADLLDRDFLEDAIGTLNESCELNDLFDEVDQSDGIAMDDLYRHLRCLE